MSALRQRLPRFAALVLLVWLFATGVAFAHTCNSKVDIDCEECCAEMKAVEAWTGTDTVTLAGAQPATALPAPVAVVTAAWPPAVAAARPAAAAPDPGGGHDIPLFFLRLAL